MIRFTLKLLLASLLATPLCLQAQETWSLERCVRYAQETNLSIQQANLSVRSASLSERQAKASRLPNLSASIGLNEQFGRTIDPFTNQFNNLAITSNSIGLSGGVTLYNGGQINNQIKQASWDVLAAQADAEQVTTNFSLQVAQAYLTILLSEEQQKNSANRITQSRQQLVNTLKLIKVGTLPAADSLNLVAQIARDEQNAVVTQNNIDLAYLNLKQLLQLEPDAPFQIERPQILVPTDANPEGFMLKPIYNTALNTQATIRAGDFRMKSAESGVDIAKGGYMPQVSLFANLSSAFSTAAKNYTFIGDGTTYTTNPVSVEINGFPATLAEVRPNGTTEDKVINYFTQVNQNFGQIVGLNVNIPIYQNSRIDFN